MRIRKIISALLAVLIAIAVFVPAVAQSTKTVKAAETHKCQTYQLTPAENLIIQKKADEFLAALQSKKNASDPHYVITLPSFMLMKYDRNVLWRMIELTARKRSTFIAGRYAESQFLMYGYDAPNGCGYIFKKLLTDEQMRQTEETAKNLVSDLKNKQIPEKDKVKEIYKRLDNTMSYDEQFCTIDANGKKNTNTYSETAYGALIKHKAVCCGAAMALKLMCYYAGIKNFSMEEGYLNVNTKNYGSHAWNTYFDGKKTYLIDLVNHHCLEEKIKDCTYTNYIIGNGTYFLETL